MEPYTDILIIHYLTQHVETAVLGPSILVQQYRRLNASAMPRLVVFDLGGPDILDARRPVRLAVMEDIMLSNDQRATFEHNLADDKKRAPFHDSNSRGIWSGPKQHRRAHERWQDMGRTSGTIRQLQVC